MKGIVIGESARGSSSKSPPLKDDKEDKGNVINKVISEEEKKKNLELEIERQRQINSILRQ